ncbi:MAG: hypothetical protein AB7O48_08850 [Cyclobacteriaceae bacterium]
MKSIVFFCVYLAISNVAYTQTESVSKGRSDIPVLDVGGQAMLSLNNDHLFFNMGGGGLSVRSTRFAISVNFLPSLRYEFDTDRITPTLGIGPHLHLNNRLIIGMPVYYYSDQWHPTFGVGYKFQRACPQ